MTKHSNKPKLSKTQKAEPYWLLMILIGIGLVAFIAIHSK